MNVALIHINHNMLVHISECYTNLMGQVRNVQICLSDSNRKYKSTMEKQNKLILVFPTFLHRFWHLQMC